MSVEPTTGRVFERPILGRHGHFGASAYIWKGWENLAISGNAQTPPSVPFKSPKLKPACISEKLLKTHFLLFLGVDGSGGSD